MRLTDASTGRAAAILFEGVDALGPPARGGVETRPAAPPRVAALPKWRLRRVLEHIEAHFAEAMTLADMAAAAGLSRMHFAAQFKAAMRLRPHEYLLRRRVARARELLADDTTSVVEVALSVGFQTQSHFTSVFKRFVGQPPHAWRRAHWEGVP